VEQRSEAVPVCVVPSLKGWSLKADRKRLREAGCRLGDIRGARSKTAKVIKQFPAPGTTRAAGAAVAVKLAG
jgi:beta-lactam-binding protein with PASTA domain